MESLVWTNHLETAILKNLSGCFAWTNLGLGLNCTASSNSITGFYTTNFVIGPSINKDLLSPITFIIMLVTLSAEFSSRPLLNLKMVARATHLSQMLCLAKMVV